MPVRAAEAKDAGAIVDLIRLLAVYEKEEAQMKMTEEQFRKDGFEEPRRFHCFVAENDQGQVVGYALYFFIYSTWEGVSMYLEDLFVRKEERGKGYGMALVQAVVGEAQRNSCARLQWQVIDWNAPALEFYKNRMFARERMETGDAKWINMIMGREEMAKFMASQ
ncbi:N-acetyltransferase [Salpingoeca rosetta]|uniref:N-acetyltransferase n=1 Tax=Salpingoeca rosetta (strain ATCC 50818 / BSB-021) TaxID=946362 RepID=F2U310_SALR5|nr:N-acetyltransferase [Salpingoeca rosetta]EGD82004.1 N-acetyltransferase [Salpingoeca rosetta]|eukprot:XP_004996187.1 N-acetyltransferase [Salpingoeca rosetta]